nr:hypothetical protein [Acanthopleuribacter pedis]
MNPGLGPIRDALASLQHPHHAYRHVTVGGTNGKGTLAFNLMKQLPGKVGLFCSPHLVDIRERITINGNFVADRVWQEAYAFLSQKIDPRTLSYFELMLLTAVVVFQREAVDWAVFEVGLGGRWDAVNALAPELMVLTNVSLDHTRILGDTVEAIALVKIDIARTGKPFILPASIYNYPSVKTRLLEIKPLIKTYSDKGTIEDNLTCYNRLCYFLPIQPLSELALPLGRKMKVSQNLYVDASHNRAGWQSTVLWLQKHHPSPIRMLCNLSADRNVGEFVSIFKNISADMVVLPGDYEKVYRGVWPETVRFGDWNDLSTLMQEPVLVTGSLYFVGEFLRRFPTI